MSVREMEEVDLFTFKVILHVFVIVIEGIWNFIEIFGPCVFYALTVLLIMFSSLLGYAAFTGRVLPHDQVASFDFNISYCLFILKIYVISAVYMAVRHLLSFIGIGRLSDLIQNLYEEFYKNCKIFNQDREVEGSED